MPYINFYSARPALKLLIVFLSIVTIGIIVFFIGLLLGRVIFWMHLDEVNHVLYGRYDMLSDWQLKFFQLMQTIGFFLLPGFFLYWIFSSSEQNYFEAKKTPGNVSILLVLIAFVVGMPFINWVVEINKNIELPSFFSGLERSFQNKEEIYAGLTERLLEAPNMGHLLFNIFMIAVIPAIGEEFIFRGVLQKIFKEVTRNIHISVFITAFIFSAIHGQFYGLVPRFLLGIFFGYLMVWSGTIWLPVIAHFINNAIAVITYYLLSGGSISVNSGLASNPSIFVIISSLILFVVTVLLIRKFAKRKLFQVI
jgi:uncharacterized protein